MSEAKSVKEIYQAMLWMFENGLDWTQHNNVKGRDGNVANPPMSENSTYQETQHIYAACLIGAMYLTDANDSLRDKAKQKLLDIVPNSEKYAFIHQWNDEAGRTKEEVTNLLKTAIKDLP